MKKQLLVLSLIAFSACEKQNSTPETGALKNSPDTTVAQANTPQTQPPPVVQPATSAAAFITKPELEKIFREYKYEGSFVMLDLKNNKYTQYNPEGVRERVSPASTFKIFNSLVALETGVIANENTPIKWDGTKTGNPAWDQDTDMKKAFENSTVWFYQEMARRVDVDQMRKYITQEKYGNMDISGDIDEFWLNDALKISPLEQVDFLKRLYLNQTSFSQRSMDITKKIMLKEEKSGFKLRAKTGWGIKGNLDIGWFVGWFETGDNVYFFATNVQTQFADAKVFTKARIDITNKIFKELGIFGGAKGKNEIMLSPGK
ncbi:MAG: class D beta-lactamase [Bacteroidota bacterium]